MYNDILYNNLYNIKFGVYIYLSLLYVITVVEERDKC